MNKGYKIYIMSMTQKLWINAGTATAIFHNTGTVKHLQNDNDDKQFKAK